MPCHSIHNRKVLLCCKEKALNFKAKATVLNTELKDTKAALAKAEARFKAFRTRHKTDPLTMEWKSGQEG